jgi:DNA polymerase I
MAKKWMNLLDQELSRHNTAAASREVSEVSSQPGGESTSEEISKNGYTPEKDTDKIDKNNSSLTKECKKTKKKKKLTLEEEAAEVSGLAETHPSYVVTDERGREVLKWARQVPEVALDIETYGRHKRDGLLYTKCQVRMILLSGGGQSWFLDCNHVSNDQVVRILKALKDKPKYLHNALFDIPRLYRQFGVLLEQHIEDTMIASRVARAGEWERKKGRSLQISHSLDDCIKRELGVEIPKNTKLKWGVLLTEDHFTYAGDDIQYLKVLHCALEDVLGERGVLDRYQAIRDRLPDFIGSAVRGIPLDAEKLQPILDGLEAEKGDLEARLDELAPEHPEDGKWVWGNTSREITPEGKGRSGALRALKILGLELTDLQDQTLLDHLEEHEIVGVLYNYRKKANTLSRYCKWIPDFYDETTGRLYPQPKVAAAVTGRVLYSDPNAQGIDKKKTKEFRNVVRAPSEAGRAIVKGDFAQQELRIAAYFSEDRAMLRAFRDGRDIYQETAKKLVGHEVSKDDPARAAAKRATLGFLYGLGVDKYRTNVYKDTQEKLSGEQALKDRQAFRAAFPTFYNWQRRYGSRPEWFTRSVLGWRRYVSPSRDKRTGGLVPKYTERLNGPIQSTAGDILYLTLQKMGEDPRPDTHFLLSVHDELVLECPEDDAREVALWLKEKMRSSIEDVLGRDLGGEKSVEVSYGPSWGETTEEV